MKKMDAGKKVKITTKPQFDLLLNIMDEHKNLAKGFHFSDKNEYKVKWVNFADQLNFLGPPQRDGKGWEKVWYDLKNKVKQKISKNKKRSFNTIVPLSSMEQKVEDILNFRELNNKSPIISLTKSDSNIENLINTFIAQESNQSEEKMEESSTNFELKTQTNKSTRDLPTRTSELNKLLINKKLDLLKEQLSCLEKIQNSIKDQTQIIKKDNNAKYIKKMYKIQKKKLDLHQKNLKRKEEMRMKKDTWRMELLKYKQEKLNIMKTQLNYEEVEM